jgi:hypothetical protein
VAPNTMLHWGEPPSFCHLGVGDLHVVAQKHVGLRAHADELRNAMETRQNYPIRGSCDAALKHCLPESPWNDALHIAPFVPNCREVDYCGSM